MTKSSSVILCIYFILVFRFRIHLYYQITLFFLSQGYLRRERSSLGLMLRTPVRRNAASWTKTSSPMRLKSFTERVDSMVPLTSQTPLGLTGVEVGAELDGSQTGTKQKNMSNQLGEIVIFMEERMRGSSHSRNGLHFQSWRVGIYHNFPVIDTEWCIVGPSSLNPM